MSHLIPTSICLIFPSICLNLSYFSLLPVIFNSHLSIHVSSNLISIHFIAPSSWPPWINTPDCHSRRQQPQKHNGEGQKGKKEPGCTRNPPGQTSLRSYALGPTKTTVAKQKHFPGQLFRGPSINLFTLTVVTAKSCNTQWRPRCLKGREGKNDR